MRRVDERLLVDATDTLERAHVEVESREVHVPSDREHSRDPDAKQRSGHPPIAAADLLESSRSPWLLSHTDLSDFPGSCIIGVRPLAFPMRPAAGHWRRLHDGALPAALYIDWAALLRRTFEVDVLARAKCGGRLQSTKIPSRPKTRTYVSYRVTRRQSEFV